MDIVVKVIKTKAAMSSQSEVAKELGVSPQYLSDILREKRSVSEAVAAKLGFERVWRKVSK